MKIAALYARVSTGRQEKEETIETQVFAVKEYAKANGITLVREYRDDGWTGTMLARPALDELRLDARKKIWDAVIVYDPDRIARKYAYQSLVIDELDGLGVPVLFVTTPPAKTDEDRLLYGVKGLFAEYERARNAEKFRLGKIRKAREGKVVHGDAPYGYRYIYKTKEKDCYYEINQKEAEVVRQIFHWVGDEGMTLQKVIKRLHELKIPPRKGKRETWTNGPISRIVRNETYIGTTYYNKNYAVAPTTPKNTNKYKRVKLSSRRLRPKEEWIPIPVPRIIDDELFNRVQKQLAINAQFAMRNKKHDYLLSHLLWCECGSRFFGEGAGTQFYYRCTDRLKTYPNPPQCKGAGVNIIRLDVPVWDKVHELLTNPLLIQRQIERWMANASNKAIVNELALRKERLLRALQAADDEEKRYVKAYGEGLTSLEMLKSSVDGVRKRKAALFEQLKGFTSAEDSSANRPLPPPDVIRERLPQVLKMLSKGEKQMILRKLIKEIVVNTERTSATIRGSIPLNVSEVKENQKYGLEPKSRHRGTGECGEIDAV